MKYSKTTLMELSHKYRSILRRCAFLNAAILLSTAIALPAMAAAPYHNFHNTGSIDEYEDNVIFANYNGTNDPDSGLGDTNSGLGGAILNFGALTFDGTAKFNSNTSTKSGGAIYSEGSITFNDEATFDGNTSGDKGGAIFNSHDGNCGLPTADIIFKDKVTFKNNTATVQGGAISNGASDSITFEKLATFDNNYIDSTTSGSHNGNVIFNTGKMVFQGGLVSKNNKGTATEASGIENSKGILTVIGGDIEISNNEAASGAGMSNSGTLLLGAYLNGSSEIVADPVDKITFKNNKALNTTAGALYAGGTTKLYANTILFEGNSNNNDGSSGAYGGAIALQGGTLDILGTTNTFNNNHSYATATGDYATKTVKFGGGAIQNRGNTTPSNITIGADENSVNSFTGNTSAMHGGAIHARAENASHVANTIFYGTTSFTSNEAALNGGAISNSPISGTSTFTFNGDTSFSNNSASGLGGALFNTGAVTFNGAAVFSGNTDSSGANDIYNGGTINFNGDVTLDGGIVNTDGVLNFKSGTTLTLADVLSGSTIISGGTIKANGATLDSTSFVVSKADTYTFADSTFDSDFGLSDNLQTAIDNNLLYDITYSEGKFTVAEKEASDIAEDVIAGGATAQEAQTIAAVAEADSTHPVVDAIKEALQTGNVAAVAKAAEDLAPTTSQQVMGIAQSVNTLLNNVTGTRMAALGKAGGDAFIGGSTWVQGLYNHSKQDASGNNAGFSANTKGIAFGIDGKVNEAVTIGLGYGYTKTDADSRGRDVDVDGHNFFIYGQYQPDAWYVNTMLSYGLNKYEEKKTPMGVAMKAKYDVNTFAANVMTGYDFDNGITPEGGFRYVLADQESYNDGAQRVSTDKNDVLTAVMGVKYSTNVKAEDWTFKPTLRLAATYDVVSDNSKANVNVTGGSNYQITGDRLHRFGVETGVGVTSSVKDWDLTLEYNGGFRKDFQSHTGMLKATYHF